MTTEEYLTLRSECESTVMRQIRKRVRDDDTCEEISSQVWLWVWRDREKIPAEKRSQYLNMYTQQGVHQHYRRSIRKPAITVDFSSTDVVAPHAKTVDASAALNSRLSALRPHLNEVQSRVLTAWVKGLEKEDIATECSIPVGSVAFHKRSIREIASKLA